YGYPGRKSLFLANLRLLFGKNEIRFDIHRHIAKVVERLLHHRSDQSVLVEHRFCFFVRAFGLDCEYLTGELANGVLDLRGVYTEGSGGFVHLYPALIEEVIELKRLAFAVSFGYPETDRTK